MKRYAWLLVALTACSGGATETTTVTETATVTEAPEVCREALEAWSLVMYDYNEVIDDLVVAVQELDADGIGEVADVLRDIRERVGGEITDMSKECVA